MARFLVLLACLWGVLPGTGAVIPEDAPGGVKALFDFLGSEAEWAIQDVAGLRVIHRESVDPLPVVDRARFAHRHLQAWIGKIPAGKKVQICMLAPSEWQRARSQLEAREDAVAMTLGSWIFLQAPADASDRAWTPVFYELVHAWLYRIRGDRRPSLWLDEGLSGHLGVRLARVHAGPRGREWQRRWPEEPGRDGDFTLREITRARTLPADPLRAGLFYRRAEDLVILLVNQVGLPEVIRLATEGGHGGRWRNFLRREHGWRSMEFRRLEGAFVRSGML